MTECEALLLGREQVHGSANGTALATLCKSLMRRTDLHRKYILRCHRENGLQMVPHRRLEDEGFESDEDLTSLGSCDDNSSSIYVSDHALHIVKCHTSSTSTNGSPTIISTTSTTIPTSATTSPLTTNTICNPRTSSQSSNTDVTSGSVSSVGTDSANSSGASDNDETDNSLSHNVNHSSSNSSSSNSSNSNCCCSCCNSSPSSNHHCTNHNHNLMLCTGASKGCKFDVKTKLLDDVECFAYHEIAFCHTDPALPKIIVWVIKTKRQSKSAANEYSYGLEAVVFLCLSEQKFRALYKSFQEFSRRQKLEKPLRSRWKDEYHRNGTVTTTCASTTTTSTAAAATTRVSSTIVKPAAATASVDKAPTSRGESKTTMTNNAVMYNLVQRVDTDGVTHIEVTRPVAVATDVCAARVQLAEHSNEPSSIISINTPDSGDVLKTVLPKKSDTLLIESVIRTTEEKDTVVASKTPLAPPPPSSSLLQPPPERPERKKSAKSLFDKEKMAVVHNYNSMPNREKVVKGQYVRVSVDQKTISSPLPRGTGSGWLFNELKPVGANNVLTYPSRLVWSRSDSDNYQKQQLQQQQHQFHDLTLVRRGRKPEKDHREHRHHHRSKSSVILRRAESPKRYPMPHRYVDAIQINNSLPNRFFGRLKELTTGHHGGHGGNSGGSGGGGGKFKRRNSIGDMSHGNSAANGHHPSDGKKFDKHNALAKSTPNLKSMIKNKNGRFCKDGYNENEPKKVTFSAYATVQVVD